MHWHYPWVTSSLSVRNYLSRSGGRSRGKQHRGLRTKALMRGLETRLECRHKVFVRTEKTLGKFTFRKKNYTCPDVALFRSLAHDYPIAPSPRLVSWWSDCGYYHRQMFLSPLLLLLHEGPGYLCWVSWWSCGWQRSVNNFLGSLALIQISWISIKVWLSESILQYQKPGGPLAKCRGFQKEFYLSVSSPWAICLITAWRELKYGNQKRALPRFVTFLHQCLMLADSARCLNVHYLWGLAGNDDMTHEKWRFDSHSRHRR